MNSRRIHFHPALSRAHPLSAALAQTHSGPLACALSVFLALAVLCCSCGDNRTESEKRVSEWQGREIIPARDMVCHIMGRDTAASGMWDKPFKILVVIDSAGCTGCQLRLEEWKELILNAKPVSDRVGFLFCFQTDNSETVDLLFMKYGVSYPYFMDREGKMQKANLFPDDVRFRTFLLDRDNKVVLIGSPAGNKAMWNLYRAQIMETLKLTDNDWPQ